MEQSIYTYCYKRQGETGGGWGYYSYSAGMKILFEHNEALKNILGADCYELAKNLNTWLTPQVTDYEKDIENERILIEKYQPEKYSYQKININGKEMSFFSYARNLGREIIAENRPANKIVYALAGDPSEVKDYPCFYYGNPYYQKLDRAYFKASDENVCADLLQPVQLDVNNVITREKVHTFLSSAPERADILVSLFYVLIQEKSGMKRPVIICDQKDNIPVWISALTLLFPKEIAEEIFFSTYEFLGSELGSVQIPENFQVIGVYSPTANDAPEESATNYDISVLEKREDVVICDIECGIIPNVQQNEFAKIIYEFCEGNEKPLLEYQQFIIDSTKYRDYGMQYVDFYPLNQKKNSLFNYYSRPVQQEIFDDVYPLLYDAQSTESDLEEAINIVNMALNVNIISEASLAKDLEAFLESVLLSPYEDFTRLRKLKPLSDKIGKNFDTQIKQRLINNTEKITQVLSVPTFPAEKYSYMLSLLDPYIKEELDIIRKFCNVISNNENGAKNISSCVKKWLENGFNTINPMYSPKMLFALLDLASDDSCIDAAAFYSQKWNQPYRLDMYKFLESSEYAVVFYNSLLKYLWQSEDSFNAVYHNAVLLSSIRSRYAQEWKTYWFHRLKNTDIFNQKKIFEQSLLNPEFQLDIEAENQIQKIFFSYSFRNLDEIAVFAYLVYFRKNITIPGSNVAEWVAKAASAQDFQKKAWKKAVSSVPHINRIPEQIDTVIRQLLITDIQLLSGSEKKGFLSKLLGKK